MNEVAQQPDIMGEFRGDIENFYRRDHVEIVRIMTIRVELVILI